MEAGPPRRRRARPVADAPVDALLARLEGIAKGWLLALLEDAPLDDMPSILAADLAQEGPRLCDAVVRALAEDRDLKRLEAGGALERLAARAGELAGATSVASTLRAVDALHEVMWAAVRDALPESDPDQISELAARLALVMSLVRAAALRQVSEGAVAGLASSGAATRSPDAPTSSPGAATSSPDAPTSSPGAATSSPDAVTSEEPKPEPSSGDTGDEPPPEEFVARRGPRMIAVPAQGPPTRVEPEAARSGTGAAGERAGDPVRPRATTDSQALWVGAFEEELARADRTGAQLSLLLAELEDADRVLAVEEPGEASATFGRFAQAVRDAVRRQDILASESESRAWVIARDTGRAGAQSLAARIATLVAEAPQWRGAPLSVTIGISVLGEDGRDPPTMIEVAEEARFAAAASGIAVVPAGPPPDDSA